jgi:hypothetical protein
MNTAELVFEFVPNGKASGTTVTARLGDDVLHVDRFDVAKQKPRDTFIEFICKDRPGINRADVERVLLQRAAEHAARQATPKEPEGEPGSDELLQRMPEHVRTEARAMLEAKDLLGRVFNDIAALGVAGEAELVATIYLIGVSRLLPRPLAAIVQAPSSTGKTFAVETTTSPFPPEAVIRATSLTTNALYYMPPGSLRHKFIVAGERSRREDDDTAEVTRALREMLSSGKLTKAVPEKRDGCIETVVIEQAGPIAYVETTTLTRIFDEDLNRSLLLSADEREQQTRNIVRRLAGGYSGAVRADVEAIIQKHWALQRMLQQRPVIVPFAEQIAERFPVDRVEARRAFPHLIGMVQACALLHQFQRKLSAEGEIIAAIGDYEMARHLCRGPLARQLGGRLADATLRYHGRLVEWAGNRDKFSTTEAVKHDHASDRAIRGWLNELASVGAVEQLSEGKGSRPATWRTLAMDPDELAAGDCGLPEPTEIRS